MATLTKSIGTSSRDYSTITAWEADCSLDLVTDGDIWRGECYADSEFTPSNDITISGHTTDASNYIILTAATGESWVDNVDVSTDAVRYNTANGVCVRATDTYGYTFLIFDSYTQVSKLMIGSPSSGSCIQTYGSNGSSIDACLCQGSFHGINVGATGISNLTIQNTVVFLDTSNDSSKGIYDLRSTCVLKNVLVVSNYSGTPTGVGINRLYSGDTTVYNVACFGFGTAFGSSAYWAGSNNASDDSSTPGTSPLTSLTLSDEITSTTSGTYDMRTKAGSNLIDAGSSNGTTTDAFGTTWGTHDITFYDYPGGGSPPTDAYVWFQVIN